MYELECSSPRPGCSCVSQQPGSSQHQGGVACHGGHALSGGPLRGGPHMGAAWRPTPPGCAPPQPSHVRTRPARVAQPAPPRTARQRRSEPPARGALQTAAAPRRAAPPALVPAWQRAEKGCAAVGIAVVAVGLPMLRERRGKAGCRGGGAAGLTEAAAAAAGQQQEKPAPALCPVLTWSC